jgi:hypothetical protein
MRPVMGVRLSLSRLPPLHDGEVNARLHLIHRRTNSMVNFLMNHPAVIESWPLIATGCVMLAKPVSWVSSLAWAPGIKKGGWPLSMSARFARLSVFQATDDNEPHTAGDQKHQAGLRRVQDDPEFNPVH